MADIRKLAPILLQWEGKFADNPADLGGPTNMGVTLKTMKKLGIDKNNDGLTDVDDLKALNENDVIYSVLKPYYWDRWQADCIGNQSIANFLVDWTWMSGNAGITIPQAVLGVKEDGIVGNKTLKALNEYADQAVLFEQLKNERSMYIERICNARPANKQFRKGWQNRLAAFKFMSVLLLLVICLNGGGCKSTSLLSKSITQEELRTNDSLHYEQQAQVAIEVQCQEAITTSVEDVIMLPASPYTVVYLRKYKQQIQVNKAQQQTAEIQSQAVRTQTGASSKITTVTSTGSKDGKLKMILAILSLLLLLLIAYRLLSLLRKQ